MSEIEGIMSKVYLNIEYVLKEDCYLLDTDLNRDGIIEVLETFLHMQIGKGKDTRDPDKRERYMIKMGIDLSEDAFSVWDDCGNKGLRDGILMCLLNKIKDSSVSIKCDKE